MKVLLTTFGSHGDIFPFLGIGRALAGRGHTCRVATHPYFTPEIEAAGLVPAPVIEDVPLAEILRHPDLFHRVRGPVMLGRAFVPMMRAFAVDLRRLTADWSPDVMVGHFGSVAGRWVAEAAGLPFVSVALSPIAWHSPGDPVPAYQLEPGRAHAAGARLVAHAVDPALRFAYGWSRRKLRRECGFAGPARTPDRNGRPTGWPSPWDEFRAGDLRLGMWPAAFRSALPGDPPGARLCGFPWHAQPDRAIDPRLESFLGSGEPPIVFTLGSAAVNSPRAFFALAAAACAKLGARGVLLTGRGNVPPPELPREVIAVDWAPHAWLFPRAAVNVHHAGIGSTAESLRAGRPSLAIPHAYDQFNNAIRARELGAGLLVARHRLTFARLVAALDHARRDEALARRARELAPAMAPDGAGEAAGAIEWLRPRSERQSAAA